MKFTIISDPVKEYFKELDPFALLEVDYPAQPTFIGGYVEDEESQYGIPVAMAILSSSKNAINILWMCVLPQLRGLGYGEELLNYVFSTAKENGKEDVNACFLKLFGRVTYCRGDREYFRERGFDEPRDHRPDCQTMKVSTYFSGEKNVTIRSEVFDSVGEEASPRYLKEGVGVPITLAQLKKNTLFDGKANTDIVSSMSDVNYLTIHKLLSYCHKNGGAGLLADMGENLDLNVIDLDLSCFIQNKDEFEGMLLVLNPEPNLLIPTIFRSFSPKYGNKLNLLMQYAYRKAVEKYPPYARIIFRQFDEKSAKLTEMVFSHQQNVKSQYDCRDFWEEISDFSRISQKESIWGTIKNWDKKIVYRRLKNPPVDFIRGITDEKFAEEVKRLSGDSDYYLMIAVNSDAGTILGSTLVSCGNSVHKVLYLDAKEGYPLERILNVLFTAITRLADQKNVQVIQKTMTEGQEEENEIFRLMGFQEKSSDTLELTKAV